MTTIKTAEEIFRRVHSYPPPEIAAWWAKTEDGQEALAAEWAHYRKKVMRWTRTKEGRSALTAAEAGDAALLLWQLKRQKKQARKILQDVAQIAHLLPPTQKRQIQEDIDTSITDMANAALLATKEH